jgi:hypothetical protein
MEKIIEILKTSECSGVFKLWLNYGLNNNPELLIQEIYQQISDNNTYDSSLLTEILGSDTIELIKQCNLVNRQDDLIDTLNI